MLVAGCGDVGGELARRLVVAGHAVWGARRRTDRLPPGVRGLALDLLEPTGWPELPPRLDAVVYTAAASGRDDAAYREIYVDAFRRLLSRLESEGHALRQVLFTSSTAVYGQNAGEWVDESSPTEPSLFTGRRLLEAERVAAAAPWPATVLRLGGLYGPGRTRLLEEARRGAAVQRSPPAYTNRIHRDDAAAALEHLLALADPDAVYLGVDREPASRYDVLSWLRGRLGLPPPPPIDLDGAEARGAPQGKRASSRRLRASGFRFRFPTFRDGYGALLTARGADRQG